MPTTSGRSVKSLSGPAGQPARLRTLDEAGTLPADEFPKTDIHRIEMGERFHCSTKLDRDPESSRN